jgi:hypothetical protein
MDGPTPTPIERILVDRVVTCELHLSYLEELFVEALKDRNSAPRNTSSISSLGRMDATCSPSGPSPRCAA